MALAKDPEIDNETKETRKFLEIKVRETSKFIDMKIDGQVHGWGRLSLNVTAVKEVEAYQGITHVGAESSGRRNRVVVGDRAVTSSPTSAPAVWPTVSQATTWAAQEGEKLARRRLEWVA